MVLVRERRTLATPLELGSHESVTPVNNATKSVKGKKMLLAFIILCMDVAENISHFIFPSAFPQLHKI